MCSADKSKSHRSKLVAAQLLSLESRRDQLASTRPTERCIVAGLTLVGATGVLTVSTLVSVGLMSAHLPSYLLIALTVVGVGAGALAVRELRVARRTFRDLRVIQEAIDAGLGGS